MPRKPKTPTVYSLVASNEVTTGSLDEIAVAISKLAHGEEPFVFAGPRLTVKTSLVIEQPVVMKATRKPRTPKVVDASAPKAKKAKALGNGTLVARVAAPQPTLDFE